MDLNNIIAELEAERDRLDQAILALQRLSVGSRSKRGRPPKWLASEIGKHSGHSPDHSRNGNPPKPKRAG